MKPLPIDVRPDEAAVRRMWSAIEDRLEPRRPRWGLAFLVAPVAAAMLLVWLARPHRAIEPALDTPTIAAAPDARVELLESDAQQVTVQLHEGRAQFRAGRERRLVIEAGVARVEAAPTRVDVIETSFEVYRSGESLRIVVERGELLVRSPDIADGVRRLAAGESLVLEAARPAPPPPPPAPPPDDVSLDSAGGSNGGTNGGTSHSRTRGVDGGSDGARPAEVEKVSVEELLGDADRLRRAGKLEEAVRVLALVAEAPGDPLAGMAWLTRARVLLELGRESEAAKDLARAIDAGLPPALEQRARARLEELAP